MVSTKVIGIAVGCVLLFAGHLWMVLMQRQAMGSQSGDRAKDPIFTKDRQKRAFVALFILQILSSITRVLHAYDGRVVENWTFYHDHFFALGIFLFSFGFGFRLWAQRVLGRFFTFEIGIRREHQMIEVGPYRWIRHPSYTGYLAMIFGISFALGSGLFAAVGCAGVCAFLWMRMNQEEEMLTSHFGHQYEEYMLRTKRLIPWLY